ncbi:MAG TPA: hypothetical protein VMA09_17770 [Candidatus Binataceae bacterium]|nr:hypothetical protein [Candidatus Binataceae bacterium]
MGGPANAPARLFFRRYFRTTAPVFTVCLILAAAVPVVFADGPSPSTEAYSAENACTAIKSAVGVLAEAERAEALGLNLTTEKATPAVVEVRLNDLIERSDQLAATLRAVRMSSMASDSQVQDCIAMGERTLASAQKLCSDVEEILYGAEAPVADAPPIRLGVPGSAPSRQP